MNKSIFDRFLGELLEPVPREHVQRATSTVLQSLEAGELARLGVVVALVVESRRSFWRPAIAVFAAVVLAATLQFVLSQQVGNSIVARTESGRAFWQTESIHSGSDGIELILADGSRVEMSPNAVLSVTKATSGIRIFLSDGHVIVTAAKQGSGHLFVQTKDCEISVIGTVFSVKAGPEGSRVTVVEGEVQFRQGENTRTLLPGDQVVTSVAVESVPVPADIAWSSKATELVALLQEAAQAPQQAAPVSTENEPGTLSGIVTDSGTHEGIGDVPIGICEDPDPLPLTPTGDGRVIFRVGIAIARCNDTVQARTDGSGRFVIKDLAPGRYVVRVRKSGYLAPFALPVESAPETFRIERSLENWAFEGGPPIAVQSFTVDQGLRPVTANLSLVRAGRLKGTVRNTDFNRPAENVPVQLGTIAGTGPQSGFKPLASVNTNALGNYRFQLPPAEYVLFAGRLSLGSTSAIPENAVHVSIKAGEDVTAEPLMYRDPLQR